MRFKLFKFASVGELVALLDVELVEDDMGVEVKVTTGDTVVLSEEFAVIDAFISTVAASAVGSFSFNSVDDSFLFTLFWSRVFKKSYC